MSILSRVVSWFGRDPEAERFEAGARTETPFVYVKIPEDIGPVDRGAKYEDPIEEQLQAAGLGQVSGGGSALGTQRADGTQGVEFCGIDLDVTHLDRALALLRETLPKLGAPDGTELHYTVSGTRLLDAYAAGAWKLAQPREMLHPGFGI
jgi:hypothetical protein